MPWIYIAAGAAAILIWNVVTFALFGVDKHRARHRRRRVPEQLLLVMAAMGGSWGAMLGMQHYHHKTRKRKFRVLISTFLTIQTVVVICLLLGNVGNAGEGSAI